MSPAATVGWHIKLANRASQPRKNCCTTIRRTPLLFVCCTVWPGKDHAIKLRLPNDMPLRNAIGLHPRNEMSLHYALMFRTQFDFPLCCQHLETQLGKEHVTSSKFALHKKRRCTTRCVPLPCYIQLGQESSTPSIKPST